MSEPCHISGNSYFIDMESSKKHLLETIIGKATNVTVNLFPCNPQWLKGLKPDLDETEYETDSEDEKEPCDQPKEDEPLVSEGDTVTRLLTFVKQPAEPKEALTNSPSV